jgi:ribosomal protein L22
MELVVRSAIRNLNHKPGWCAVRYDKDVLSAIATLNIKKKISNTREHLRIGLSPAHLKINQVPSGSFVTVM